MFKYNSLGFLILIALMGCSSAPQPKTLQLKPGWSRSTLAEENYGIRHTERTAPFVDQDSIYQGNGLDSVVSYSLASGDIKWRFKVKNGIESGFAVDNQYLFFGGSDGQFYALNKNNGKLIWSFPTRAENLGPPEIAQGVVYFIAGNNVLYALDAKTGKQLWNYNRGDASSISIRGAAKPALYQRTLYVGFSDGYLVAVNAAEGTMQWERKLANNLKFVDVDASPVVDEKNIWTASYDGALYCLSRQDGQVQWRLEEGSAFPVTIDGDKLYYSSLEHTVYVLNKNSGQVLWKYSFEEKYGIPTQVSLIKGLAIFGQSDGYVVALSQMNGKVLGRFLTGNGVIATPGIDQANSSVYVYSNQANLYKLGVEWKNPETENLLW